MQITEFIERVAPKLKMKVSKSFEHIDGKTLKLTGYKEVKGREIEDHKIYKIPVPVTQHIDHQRLLRLAYHRGGKQAVKNYLNKYLKPAEVSKILTVLE